MAILPTKEDFSQVSGLVNYSYFDELYEGAMDNALVEMGREIILHLESSVTEDKAVAVKNNPASYNPFFRGSSRGYTGGKNKGVVITNYRDIGYTAQIRHGPKPLDQHTGAGELSEDQVQTTTVYESLKYIENAVSATIDGKRYERFEDARIVGFDGPKYVIQVWGRIAEQEQ